MRGYKHWVAVIALITVLTACAGPFSSLLPATPTRPSTNLTVFAAASLTEPFTEIAAIFEAEHPDVHVILNFAGSQQLTEQLAQGARADVFASASQNYMDAAIEDGLANAGTPTIFARNRLVIITPISDPAGITTYADLANPGVKLVLADKAVPAGKYSLAFLKQAGLDEQVLTNVVSYEENVKAVLSKVILDEADAGIVYVSDISAEAATSVRGIDIPDELNQIAEYPITVLTAAPNPALASEFVALVRSDRGQRILANHNFMSIR